MKKQLIRIAIIGTGGISSSHFTKLSQDPDAQITACCDLSKKLARKFAAERGIPSAYDDMTEMLDKEALDAVVISTSDAAHCPLSLAAVRKGLHVLCEKPMAVTLAEARRMKRAADKAGVVAMVNFSYREMSALEQACTLLGEGRVGRIMHVEASYLQSWLADSCWGDWRKKERFLWRMSCKHHGGALNDIGCHVLDLVTCLVGSIKTVACTMKSFQKGTPRNTWKGYKLDADDGFIATAEFACGALGVIHASRWATGYANTLRVRIFGDKGALHFETDGLKEALRVCVEPFHTRRGLWNTVPAADPKVTIHQRFLRGIRSGRSEAPTFEDGLKNQSLLEACRRSQAEGKAVRVSP